MATRWIFLIVFTVTTINAHPLCYDGTYPTVSYEPMAFCSEYQALTCCSPSREASTVIEFVISHAGFSETFNIYNRQSWNACDKELIKIACLHCSPYESHLFETDENKALICESPYCATTFAANCAGSTATCETVGLPSTDPWCFPIVSPPAPTSSAGLVDAFPGVKIAGPIEVRWTAADPSAAYVASILGIIYRVVPNGQTYVATVFADFSATTNVQGEMGLLGFNFDPNYARNCYLYVFRTTTSQSTNKVNILTQEHVPNCAHVNVATVNVTASIRYIVIEKTTTNHNGGSVEFDSQGNLYLSIGDGGTQNDGSNNGQNKYNLFGKIIRITPGRPTNPSACPGAPGCNYTIPETNPFYPNNTGGLSEIFAYGFRNPWTLKIVQPGDKIYCGDVGQQIREEVNRVVLGGNYGWSLAEGDGAFNQASPLEYAHLYNSPNYVRPLADYRHSGQYSLNPRTIPNLLGFSVIYGGPYEGQVLSARYRNGFHIFADYNELTIGGMWLDEGPNPKPPSGEVLIVKSPPISRLRYAPDGEAVFLSYLGASVPSNIFKFSKDAGASICGNYYCEASESCASCPVDCQGQLTGKNSEKWCCANGVCDYGNCPVDCSARIKGSDPTNNVCEPNESCLTTNDCPSRKTTGNNDNDFCCYGSNDGPVCSSIVNGVAVMNSPYCAMLNDPCKRGESNGRGNGWGGW